MLQGGIFQSGNVTFLGSVVHRTKLRQRLTLWRTFCRHGHQTLDRLVQCSREALSSAAAMASSRHACPVFFTRLARRRSSLLE